MQKYFFILLLLLSAHFSGSSQRYIGNLNADSLKKVLTFAVDTQRINTLNVLSKRFLFGNEREHFLDSVAMLSKEALQLSTNINYGKGMGNALVNLAMVNLDRSNNYSNIFASLQRAMPLLRQAGDKLPMASGFETMGACYHFLGENKNAILAFDSCIHIFQSLGDTASSLWSMVGLAHSYCDLGNYAESYTRFRELLDITPKSDTTVLRYAYCQMAALFVAANLPRAALEYVYKVRASYPALTKDQKLHLPGFLAWIYRVGGEAYLQLNKTDSALHMATLLHAPLETPDAPQNLFCGNLRMAMGEYKEALLYFTHGYETSTRKHYEIGHTLNGNAMAGAFFELHDYSKAIQYANEALLIAQKIDATLQEKNAAGTLSQVYAAIKDYHKAYQYSELYKSLNDSLAPDEYKRKIALIQVKDQLDLQKKEARLLTTENQLSRQQIKIQDAALKRRSLLLYIFIAAILLMVAIAILVYRNVKLNRKKLVLQQLVEQSDASRKVTELENEKTHLEMQALRAQMNPHFIFNCLSSINRFILINKIDEASDYLTKFSRLIRMALQHSEKQLISLESDLEALRLYLDLERLRFKNGFNYNIIFTNSIDSNAVYIPPMLIQPFAENAIWHGLMHKKETGQLDIRLSTEGKMLTCDVIDNGIGRNMAAGFNSRSAEKNKSMGVGITAGRLALLNKSKNGAAAYTIEDLLDDEEKGCGTRITLSIPYNNLTEVVDFNKATAVL